MEDVDVHKLPRKELLQLCTDHNIRTAGVKHDDLVRLLQKKLHPPASDPPRVTPKARSQIGTNSPISSPKARSQTGTNPPFSSPKAKGKSAEKTSLPTPGSTSQGRSLRPLLHVDDLSRNKSPEPSPRTPRKDQLSPNPGVLPRKPLMTKSNSAPAQRPDLLRKKVNTLTAIGKLQAQERTRPTQQNDGSSVRGRNTVATAPMSGIGKQVQERRPQQSDHGSSVRSRSSAAIGAPKKNIKSISMPVKRPGERTLGVKSNEATRKGQTNPNAAYPEAAASSPRASEGEASVTAIAGSHSDLGSHSFGSVSEIATDGGHHAVWEGSDADDGHCVSSEPASRFTSQTERFHSPRTSTGSKLGRVAYPSWDSAHGQKNSMDSSVESNAPHGKDSDLSAAQGEENLISPCSLEDDTAFNLVGDEHGLEINSFLDAHSANPEEVNAAEGSHQVEQLEQVRTSEISIAGFQENDIIAKSEKSMREQDVGTSDNDGAATLTAGHSEFAPRDNLLMDIRESTPVAEFSAEVPSRGAEDENSVPRSISVSHLDESPTTCSDQHGSKTEETVSETSPSTTQKDIVIDRDELSNSGHPTVEHDVPASDCRQEDSSIPAVESNAPVAEQYCEEDDSAAPLGSREQEIGMAISAPEVNDIPVASSRNVTDASEAEEGQVLSSKENVEGDKWFDSTVNLVLDEDSSEEGANSQASMGMNLQNVIERSATRSPSHQESPYNSGVQLPEKNDPSTNDTCCIGKDYTITSTAESTDRVHFNMDSAPLPHPEMERSSVTPVSVNRPDSSPTPDSTAELDTAGELDLCAEKSPSPCDELQQEFDIKLRGGPKHDYNKDGFKKSNLLQSDRSEKVPLLQDGRENENTHLTRRTFPSSIMLWCSQLFSAIFGTRSQH